MGGVLLSEFAVEIGEHIIKHTFAVCTTYEFV